MAYLPSAMNLVHYPPDANKAYSIPPVVGRLTLEGTPSQAKEKERIPAQDSWYVHAEAIDNFFSSPVSSVKQSAVGHDLKSHNVVLYSASETAAVMTLAIPDVAMAFNALALACTVYSLLFMGLFALNVRNYTGDYEAL
jgi:hypothetical protein